MPIRIYTRYFTLSEISENYQIRKYYRERVIERISLIPSVIYLNIERTGKNLVELERRNLILRRNLRAHYPYNINSPSSKMVRIETLFEAIMEIQEMIRRQIFEMRNKELEFSEQMKKSMNLSLFRFENNVNKVFQNESQTKYLKNIIESEKEMLQALKDAYHVLPKKDEESVKKFYSNIKQLNKSLLSQENKEDMSDNDLKFLINQQNIYQIKVFLKLIKLNKSKIKILHSSIDKFKEIINFFYSDTGKSIELDIFGEVGISYSVEKGLHIALENVKFYNTKKSSIFMKGKETNALIKGCNIKNTLNNGLTALDAGRILLENSEFSNCHYAAVYLNNSNMNISNLNVNYSPNAVYAKNGSYVSVIDSKFDYISKSVFLVHDPATQFNILKNIVLGNTRNIKGYFIERIDNDNVEIDNEEDYRERLGDKFMK